MGKVKRMLEKNMMENPELYSELRQIYEDYDFWMNVVKKSFLKEKVNQQ